MGIDNVALPQRVVKHLVTLLGLKPEIDNRAASRPHVEHGRLDKVPGGVANGYRLSLRSRAVKQRLGDCPVGGFHLVKRDVLINAIADLERCPLP